MKNLDKIVLISLSVYLFINSLAFQTQAFIFANPKLNNDPDKMLFEIVYEQGYRKVHDINDEQFADYGENMVDTVPPKSNKRIRLNHNRLYLQWYDKKADFYSIFYRILIGGFATRLKFETTPYNPDFWGLGGGIQIKIPTKLDRVKFNITASWDWSYGWQNNVHTYRSVKPFSLEPDFTTGSRRDEVNWTEGAIAFWLSYPVNEKSDVYGGFSRLRTKIYVELGEYNHTRWFLDSKNGIFLGLKYLFGNNFGLSCEFHGINENTGIISLSKNI